MKVFCVFGVVLLSVVELEAAAVSKVVCPERNLTATVDDIMRLYFDGLEITPLPNDDIYNVPDTVRFPCTTRLIAIHGRQGPLMLRAGILASTNDDYVLTNSTWKCSNITHSGWETLDFDDSAWVPGIVFATNEEDGGKYIPGISKNALWIWLRQYNFEDNDDMDMEVYCRRKFAPSLCISSPCAFGGTCIEESDGVYQCICTPGYTGQNCSVVINYCESSPCTNGGLCLTMVDGYTCQCPSAYTGEDCEFVTNNCESFPCLNGGTCFNSINMYMCICAPEWTGVRCDTLRSPCDGYLCANGGTCFNDCGQPQCACQPGWTGDLCTDSITACDDDPCLNGGTCNNLGDDSFTCTCQTDWTGVRCESPNYDESLVCGSTLTWSQYNASNGFTRLCYLAPTVGDIDGRYIECRFAINGIPLYGDYTGLLKAGGNFGCVISHDYPEDLPVTSELSCADNYQQDISLGTASESARLMVCLRYPY